MLYLLINFSAERASSIDTLYLSKISLTAFLLVCSSLPKSASIPARGGTTTCSTSTIGTMTEMSGNPDTSASGIFCLLKSLSFRLKRILFTHLHISHNLIEQTHNSRILTLHLLHRKAQRRTYESIILHIFCQSSRSFYPIP